MHILLISGSLRGGSSNSATVRTAHHMDVAGITTSLYSGLADLPHFNPDDDKEPLPTAVRHLRQEIDQADAVLFCTPEYAGSLPGSFKNLLDWAVGGGEIYEKPVGWVNVSGAPTGASGAHQTLAVVLGYVGAIIVPDACVRAPAARAEVGPQGRIGAADVQEQIAHAMRALKQAVESA